MNTLQVIKVYAEASTGPLSSSPAPAGGVTTQAPQPKPIDQNKVKEQVKNMVQTMGQDLQVAPDQYEEFSRAVQQNMQAELQGLSTQAKSLLK